MSILPPNDGSSDPETLDSQSIADGIDELSGHKKTRKKWHIPLPLKLLAMVALVFLASIGYWNNHTHELPSEPLETAAQEKRESVPDLNFITGAGALLKLSSYQGRVVLLSFWAHWCEPCLVEFPTIKGLANKFDPKDFIVVPVNLDNKDDEEAKAFIKNFWSTENMPFETLYDPEKKSAMVMKVESLPANFILDRHGRLVVSTFGSNDWTNQSVFDIIDSLVKEK